MKKEVNKMMSGGGYPLLNNGFTLIELLAVIVILAIIALIATPIVLDIIDSAKKSSDQRSAEYYLEAVEQAVAKEQLSGTTIKSGTYTIMKDGNLCYATQTTDSCSEEDKITVQIDSGNFTTGSVIIRDGEVVNTDVREIENFEGSIIMGGTISKSYNEETGESSIIVKIRFNDVLGEVEINNIVGMLEYDPDKYTFTKYYYGNWGGSDYTTGEYSDNTIMTVSVEDSNILIGSSAYIGYKFSTDDLDAVEDSDFTYYIRVGTKEHKNVPVQQDSSSGVSIVNYVNDFNDYFKAVKSDSYDYAPGDINDDGYIDGSDLSILRQYYLGNINQACKAMDTNGDGEIDISDLVRLKRYLGRYEAPELEYSPMTGIPGHL